MKVAIVHDYIKEYGGAERVLEELLKIYPKAEVYTSLYAPQFLGPHKERFQKYNIHQSFFKYIPFAHKLISPLRILSPLAFSSFDLSNYDTVIVSQTGAYFPNFVRTKSRESKQKGAVQICYTHTPPRYLYGYMTAREWKKNSFMRVIGEVVNHFLRMVDYYASARVDYFIANSEEVKKRIKKFYKKDAVVIYPPVALREKIDRVDRSFEYYLAGGRLARAKGMDVIIEAFLKNGKLLKIFGKGFAGYEEELLSKIGSGQTSIEFVGEINDSEKLELMRGAKAFVFASHDEDFGITPVEAMGAGTPVIAYRSGGVVETVVNGVTGVFYTPNTPDVLNSAIKEFEKMKITADACMRQAEKFSDKRFDREIKQFVSAHLI